MNERNEIRTAKAGYEQAMKNIMPEKNRIKSQIDKELLNLLVVFFVVVLSVCLIFAAVIKDGSEPVQQPELVITQILISDYLGDKSYHVYYLIDGVTQRPALCSSHESVNRLLQVWARGYDVIWLNGAE